ncbi:MAG: hypothetical protein JXB39_03525 [Deltaproteobacteria bacterium]|nr:hypothetical protein [Deltaproteobacteria bacterium]
MPPGISLPPALESDVQAFLTEAGIPLAILPATEARVHVLLPVTGPPDEADASTLPAGGTIRCPIALGMAARLGISAKDLGRLLNRLEIKIHGCQLGCFP